MTHISGFERSQILLLPEAVDDYVDADNPVRFIDAFVDELDLSAAGFGRVAAKATGRPGYAPADYFCGAAIRPEIDSLLLRIAGSAPSVAHRSAIACHSVLQYNRQSRRQSPDCGEA
jgi:hypothetical protein